MITNGTNGTNNMNSNDNMILAMPAPEAAPEAALAPEAAPAPEAEAKDTRLSQLIRSAEKSGASSGRFLSGYVSSLQEGADLDLIIADLKEVVGWCHSFIEAAEKDKVLDPERIARAAALVGLPLDKMMSIVERESAKRSKGRPRTSDSTLDRAVELVKQGLSIRAAAKQVGAVEGSVRYRIKADGVTLPKGRRSKKSQ